MKKTLSLAVTLLTTFVAISIPVLISILVAYSEARDVEKGYALSFAQDVLARSEATADQVENGINEILAVPSSDPCSPERLVAMRRVDIASLYIQAIGHMSGNLFTCSSLDAQSSAIDLGPPDQIGDTGSKVRGRVVFPFAKGSSFVVIERGGYAVIVHKSLAIDITTDSEDIALAVFTGNNNRMLTSRGYHDPQWLKTLQNGEESSFIRDGYVVALAKSKRYNITTMAALPDHRLASHVLKLAMTIVPVGLLAGLFLAAVVLYLARLQLSMPTVIKSALKRDEFFLLYQPIVDLHSGRWVGAEALIRWRRPGGELVRPDLFIPVAEEFGLVQKITERVCHIIKNETSDFFTQAPDFHISINLSAADLHDRRTIALLQRLVVAIKAQPGNITVEATESCFVDHATAARIVHDLRIAGLSVAIDDFGTGYSSLAYLERFELDYLKIDRSFVEGIGTESATSKVVFHIIEMAKSLNLEMIAEGVETEAQAQILRTQGVQYAQGWYFAMPMPFEQLAEELRRSTHYHHV